MPTAQGTAGLLTFLSLAVQLSIRSITTRLVVILAHTYSFKKKSFNTANLSMHHHRYFIGLINSACVESSQHPNWIKRPLQQLVWTPGPSHPCGQTAPENDTLVGRETFSNSGRNLQPNGYSSKTLDCGWETRTLDFLRMRRSSRYVQIIL